MFIDLFNGIFILKKNVFKICDLRGTLFPRFLCFANSVSKGFFRLYNYLFVMLMFVGLLMTFLGIIKMEHCAKEFYEHF